MYRILRLSGVSRPERDAMEAALRKAKIRYYDTPSSDFGANQAALWTRTEAEASAAMRVIETAQKEWQAGSKDDLPFPKRKRKLTWQLWVVLAIVAMSLILSFINPGGR